MLTCVKFSWHFPILKRGRSKPEFYAFNTEPIARKLTVKPFPLRSATCASGITAGRRRHQRSLFSASHLLALILSQTYRRLLVYSLILRARPQPSVNDDFTPSPVPSNHARVLCDWGFAPPGPLARVLRFRSVLQICAVCSLARAASTVSLWWRSCACRQHLGVTPA